MAFSAGPNRELFKLLQSLHAQIDENDSDDSLSPYRNISDTLDGIQTVALATARSDRHIDVELCTSVLFVSSSPPNLLAFVRKTLKFAFFQNKVVIDARVQAFEFIKNYFDGVCHGTKRADMARAAELVVDVCVEAFKREQSSASKLAALDALFEAIQSAPVAVQRIQAGTHLEALFNDYSLGRTGKTKSSNTLQSKILRVMGLLGREFPASIAPFAAQIVDSCVHILETNFRGHKAPIHVLLAGAVACLKYLLFDYHLLFSSEKDKSAKKLTALFELVFEHGIVMYEEMKQYHVTRESLKFVAAHAALFHNIWAEDPAKTQITFKRLLLCCRSTHSGVPELGFLAMQSFLEVVSTTVSDLFDPSSAPGEDGHKKLFEWFMANFAGILKAERQKGASNALRRSAYYDRRRANAAAAADTALSGAGEASKGTLSSSGDYVNGSAVTWKRVQAAQVADLKVAICGCGSFAKCLAGFDTFSASDVEDILAQILACVCIFQKSERISSAANQGDNTSLQSQNEPSIVTSSGGHEPAEPSSSLTSVASLVLQLQLREGLRKDFLPVLLRACRDFILQLPPRDLRPDILARLITICSTVVLVYPRLRFLLRQKLAAELKGVFLALSTKGGSLDAILKPVTIQALVRTISSASDEDLRSLVGRFDPSTGLTDNRLLPYYLELWTTVLTSDPKASETLSRAGSSSAKGSSTSSSKLENDAGETVTDLPSLQMVFNELMGNVVSIFHRLDLTFDASTEGDGIGEINSKGVPRNPKDCALFHNLVSMVESVLQTCDVRLAIAWLPLLVSELIALSSENPHISEFYRLLGVCMQLLRSHRSTRVEASRRETAVFTDDLGAEDSLLTFVLDLMTVVPELHGEILAAVLAFILVLPSPIVHGIGFDKYSEIIVMTQRLGYTHRPSATAALDALERLRAEEPAQLHARLSTLLPPLQGYLVLSSMTPTSEDADVDAAGSNASYSVADIADVKAFETSLANERKRNADAASATSTRMGSGPSDAANSSMHDGSGTHEVAGSAEELQHRIIRFLGHLGGRSHMLLKPLREVLQDGHGLSWAPSLPAHAVSIDVGLSTNCSSSGESVSLRVDKLLPRVSEMALQSSDRDTKHASCELLHALACISCGLENQHHCSFEELYSKLFPVLLKLAADPDGFVRRLMYPLVLQFARWLSQGSSKAALMDASGTRNKAQSSTFLKDSAGVLFETLCEGLGDAVQSSLRTVCADALVELFNWISKQSANEGGSSNSLHRILAMARHPSPQKRAGAVVAIWRLRKFLQADAVLLNCEVLHVLQTLVIALELTTDRHGVRQLWKAVQVYVHIVGMPQNLRELVKQDSTRQRFKGGVRELGSWLVARCQSANYFCRRVVQKVVQALLKSLSHEHAEVSSHLNTELVEAATKSSDVEVPSPLQGSESSRDTSYVQLLSARCDYVAWLLAKQLIKQDTFVSSVLVDETGTPQKRSRSSQPKDAPQGVTALASQMLEFFAAYDQTADGLAPSPDVSNEDILNTSLRLDAVRLASAKNVAWAACLQSVLELLSTALQYGGECTSTYLLDNIFGAQFYKILFAQVFCLYRVDGRTRGAMQRLARARVVGASLGAATSSRTLSEVCFTLCQQLHQVISANNDPAFHNGVWEVLGQILRLHVNDTSSALAPVWNCADNLDSGLVDNALAGRDGDGDVGPLSLSTSSRYLAACRSLIPTLKSLRLLCHSNILAMDKPLLDDEGGLGDMPSSLHDLAPLLGRFVLRAIAAADVTANPSLRAALVQLTKIAVGFGWHLTGAGSLFEAATGGDESYRRGGTAGGGGLPDASYSLSFIAPASQSQSASSVLSQHHLLNHVPGDDRFVDVAVSVATDFFRIAEPLLISVFTSKFELIAASFATEFARAFDCGRGQLLCTLFDGVVINMQARRPELRTAFVRVVFEGTDDNTATRADQITLGGVFREWLTTMENSPTGGNSPRIEFVLDCLAKLAALSPSTFACSQSAIAAVTSLLGPWIPVHTKVGIITTILPPLLAASNACNYAGVPTVEVDNLKPVIAALKMLVLQHFPSPSTALPTTDPRSADFESLLAALLALLAESKSALVLDLLLPTLREGPKHAYARNIDRGLSAYIVGLSDLRHRSNALSTWRHLFRYFQDDQADPGLSEHIIMGICVPLFGACFNSRRSSATDVADVEGLLLARADDKGSQQSQKNVLQALMAEILAALPVHAAGTPAPANAWKKAAAFSLLQMSVCALPRDSIKGNLNAAYCGPASKQTGSELTKALCMATRKAAVTSRPDDDPTSRALYCSAAFNCLVAVVAATQDSPKIFTGLLFLENAKKGECLWTNLVDETHGLDLRPDREFPRVSLINRLSAAPCNKRSIDDVRRFGFESDFALEAQEGSSYAGLNGKPDGLNTSMSSDGGTVEAKEVGSDALAEVSSVALQGSSLSRSFSSMGILRIAERADIDDDFHRKAKPNDVGTSTPKNDDSDISNTRDASTGYGDDGTSDDDSVFVLEVDSLNGHASMHVLVVAIKQMLKRFPPEKTSSDKDASPVPGFLKDIVRHLGSSNSPVALRCFLGHAISNCALELRPWAQHFLGPLMETSLLLARQSEGSVIGGRFGGGLFNFFLRKVSSSLVWAWPHCVPLTPLEKALAGQFFSHLVKLTCRSSREQSRTKLGLVVELCHRWSQSGKDHALERLDLNGCLIEGMANDVPARDSQYGPTITGDAGPDSVLVVHSRLASLNVLAVLVQCSVPLGPDRVKQSICRELFRCLNLQTGRQRRDIQRAASEVCGLALKHSALPMLREHLHKLLEHFVRDMPMPGKSHQTGRSGVGVNFERFLDCLEKIAMYVPDFVSSAHLERIVTILPVAANPYLTEALQIVEAGVKQSAGANCVQVVLGMLPRLLGDVSVETQLATLRILRHEVQRKVANFPAVEAAEGSGVVSFAEQTLMLRVASQSLTAIFIFGAHPLVECREETYRILGMLWHALGCDVFECERSVESPEFSVNKKLRVLREEVRRGLLAGLHDPDKGLQQRVIAFWDGLDSGLSARDRVPLPTTPQERICRSFELLYDHEQEGEWLGLSSFFMLRLLTGAKNVNSSTASTTGVDDMIFDEALEMHSVEAPNTEEHFVRLRAFGGNGTSQNDRAIVPRLASIAIQLTQADNYMSQGDMSFLASGSSPEFEGGGGHDVEAAPLTFPTQDSDWLVAHEAAKVGGVQAVDAAAADQENESQAGTVLSQDGLFNGSSRRISSISYASSLQSQRSVLVSQSQDLASQTSSDGNLLDVVSQANNRMLAAASSAAWKKKKEKKRVEFSAAAYRQSILNKQRRRLLSRDASHFHSLGLRRYRIGGTFPDVQLSFADLIVPLQVLCRRDTVLATEVFYRFILACFCQDESNASPSLALPPQLFAGVSSVLAQSSANGAVVSAIFRLLGRVPLTACTDAAQNLGGPAELLSPRSIAQLAIKSSCLYAAVDLLERWLAGAVPQVSPASLFGGKSSSSSSRRGVKSPNDNTHALDETQRLLKHLRKLYQAMGEADVTLALTEATATSHEACDAVRAELNNDFSTALKTYQNLVFDADDDSEDETGQPSPSSDDVLEWDASRLRCLEQLQQWDKLLENTITSLDIPYSESGPDISYDQKQVLADTHEALWERQMQRESSFGGIDVIRNYLHSKMFQPVLAGVGPRAEDRPSELADLFCFLDACTKRPDRLSVLTRDHAPEAALLFALRADHGRALSVVHGAYARTLKLWASFHPLARYSRLRQLQMLQQVVEVEEFVYYCQANPTSMSARTGVVLGTAPDRQQALALARNWRNNQMSSFDPVSVWASVTNLRAVCLGALQCCFDRRGASAKAVSDELKDRTGRLLLQTATGVLEQRALKVAQNFFKKALDDYEQKGVDAAQTMASIHIFRTTKAQQLPCDWETRLEQTLKFVQHQMDTIPVEGGRHGRARSRTRRRMLSMLQAKVAGTMAKCAASADTDIDVDRLTEFWRSAFKVHAKGLKSEVLMASGNASPLSPSSTAAASFLEARQEREVAGTMFFNFSNFCGEMLSVLGAKGVFDENASGGAQKRMRRSKSAGNRSTAGDDGGSPTEAGLVGLLDNGAVLTEDTLVRCTMYGSMKALEAFQTFSTKSAEVSSIVPRMLRLVHGHPKEAHAVLRVFVQKLPLNAFTPWVDQMLALLNYGPAATAMLPILERVAARFPQSMFYSFRVSYPQLQKNSDSSVGKLPQLLRNDLLETFVSKLSGLHHPHLRWKEGLAPIVQLLKDGNAGEAWRRFQALHRVCIGDELADGDLHRRWSKILRKEVGKHLGRARDSSCLTLQKVVAMRRSADELSQSKTESGTNGGNGRPSLRLFSEWLADFDGQRIFASTNQLIDMPGQRQGLANDVGNHRLHVESFDQTLLTMSSKQRPKRLKVLASDMKTHPFLVKGGEDLRLDQRIEQLFDTMNDIFDADPACCQRSIRIRSYAVVPMGTDIGVVEWVDGTEPVRGAIEAEFDAWKAEHGRANSARGRRVDAPTNLIANLPATRHRQQWLGGKKYRNNYVTMHSTAPAGESARVFNECEAMTPSYLLRRRLQRATASPEAFFNVRAQFVQSMTAFSIGSYILGIGDRHLDNFLLDQCDGTIVGIDFGLAFGNGLGLPAPELIPFRLTQQFLGVHGSQGRRVFELGMVHAMRALSSNSDTLLSVMEVFIHEPLLDWNKEIKSSKRQSGPNIRHKKALSGGSKDDNDEAKAGPASASQLVSESETDGSYESFASADARGELQWVPNRKIRFAKEKLHCGNPAHIMRQEFRDSAHSVVRPASLNIEKCIMGDVTAGRRGAVDVKTSERSKQGAICESVEKQVACLVEMARDPEILGRQWVGLAPWV